MRKTKVVTTEDILLKLCKSVTSVLSKATDSPVHYSAMVQKITKTSLKPDFGCFVLFDGGFSGLVVINFDAKAALELYTKYMSHMGIPEEELATLHTSDEVADVLGELMNQMVGDFTGKIKRSLQTNITQNQPKMMAINKNINVTVDSNIDRPQARRVSFSTEDNNIFYLELSMERTEFIQLEEFEEAEELNPDDILETEIAKQLEGKDSKKSNSKPQQETNSLMDDLGI
ncbi:hypothetical protein A1OO_08405 [Enterovibrio norvegicus FF-33]|uniref:Chemotaxis protein CheX n=1 Tax=Enterovibrio norvegicus FF-454 TaxID=1185651 RepID=A0A1E5C9Z2_9GAMM|nr:DUF3334 family protein [Enterovibrio norvegicus]OEE62237.1 hypothetical protein A1OK_01635 [Enterovibrio norvegicus FF-454]OEE65822.1 hypothetical protein A1OO_08405 [Enterovibrio norvegicus FF-33]OEE89146.1 hypothetical protein A1OQ_12190 [Enterovibrio norvegicus FF-162]